MADIAKLVDWHCSTVLRCLPALENFSFLLWEDDDGRLYPFRPEMIDWDAMYNESN